MMLTINATDLPRMMACNGSRLMPPSFPVVATDTTVRNEGNAVHYLAQMVFNGHGNFAEMLNQKAPNGVFITSEMIDHVSDYLDMIRNTFQYAEDFSGIEIDTSFGNDAWQINARSDHVYHSVIGNVLHINDFKYGYGLVEVESNWTLIAHAVGFCVSKNVPYHSLNIVFNIHQPRPHHPDGKVRSWSINGSDLHYFHTILDETLRLPSDQLRAGSHCNNCPALATCPAAHAARLNAIDASTTVFHDDISDKRLAHELDLLRLALATIERGLEAREELAKHRLRTGAVIDNYSLENLLTNRQWKAWVTVDLMQALTARDVTAPPALLSPSKLEKAGISKEIIAPLTERVQTGTKLVRSDAHKKAMRLLK